MLLISLLSAAAWLPQDAVLPSPKIDLIVEFVGGRDASRSADFQAFLEANFTGVQMTSGAALRSGKVPVSALDDADVVIIDTNLVGVLPAGFSKPLVAIGGSGVHTMEGIGAKADWL